MRKRVVTPEQYAEGYVTRRGLLAWQRPYRLIRRLPNGNYLVKEPSVEPRQRAT